MPSASNSFIYKMLRKKNIELNAKRAKGDEILKANDSIKIFFSDETLSKMQSNPVKTNNNIYIKAFNELKGIDVIFEHEDFMIVYKPQGILSQKDDSNLYSVNEWGIGYLLNSKVVTEESLNEFKPSVLNRLDRNTKGLLFISKTLKGSQRLSEMLNKRTLKKYYFAKTKPGCNLSGIYKGFLYKNPKTNKVKIFDQISDIPKDLKYSPISTGIEVVSKDDKCSILDVCLITGKSHQIRAHLAHLVYPLIGDPKYNPESDKNVKFQELVAYKVIFPHLDDNDDWSSLSDKEIKISIDNA